MSETLAVVLISSIAPTIAAIAAVIVGVKNNGKLTEIHTLTNSNLTEVKRELAVSQEKIEGLRKLITQAGVKNGH